MLSLRSFTTHDESLGIQVRSQHNGWAWRIVPPGPPHDWVGPFPTPEEAHTAAVHMLLWYAASGQQALEHTANGEPDSADITLPPAWIRAFE